MLDLTYKRHYQKNGFGFIFFLNDIEISDNALCQMLNLKKDDYINILKQFNFSIAEDKNIIFYNKEDIENAIVTLKMLG